MSRDPARGDSGTWYTRAPLRRVHERQRATHVLGRQSAREVEGRPRDVGMNVDATRYGSSFTVAFYAVDKAGNAVSTSPRTWKR